MVDTSERVQVLLHALSKLPATAGIVFHGGALPGHFRLVGEFSLRGLTATSSDPDVASEGDTVDGLVAFRSRTGRSIAPFSAHPDEREVVFLPGSRFRLVGDVQVERRGVLVTVLDEVIDGAATDDPDALLQACADAIADHEPTHRAPTTPGKFTAELF
ncbi:hypothetical protein DEJ13_09770 [Curtobacterium sp. MCLR17_007]|uniref:hypothetical protein n=1 Tax=Curtobacterium sp. MCLR17_007 TaxID=2175648 RepID=UPI0011B5D150|nr:hypothetical protein [Curtobacterium sp. MCLR17_007]WIB58761.1 hypothetical protein DEJ13_09770 [Curtobacterium sp. MCLR17_007]